MAAKNEIQTIVIFITVLVILGIFIVLLFLIFLKRKNTLIKNRLEAEKRFKQEIAKTQIEIREQTLRNISWELHDNIGQLMTLAKIQVQNAKGDTTKTEEATNTIAKGLEELRALSKSINPNTIKNLNLIEALDLELKRFKRLNFMDTELNISGNSIKLDSNVNIIIFRILQEFFSNTIKYSKANKLTVKIMFLNKKLIIEAIDDGEGFEFSNINEGQGLNNMENRAKLIGAKFLLTSKKQRGTKLKMEYTTK